MGVVKKPLGEAVMATAKQRAAETEPIAPLTAPSAMGFAHESSFTLTMLMELQKSVTEINTNLQNLKSSVDSTKSKVDDLVGWKNKIIGGAIAIGAVCTIIGFALSKVSDYISIKAPAATQTVTSPSK